MILYDKDGNEYEVTAKQKNKKIFTNDDIVDIITLLFKGIFWSLNMIAWILAIIFLYQIYQY